MPIMRGILKTMPSENYTTGVGINLMLKRILALTFALLLVSNLSVFAADLLPLVPEGSAFVFSFNLEKIDVAKVGRRTHRFKFGRSWPELRPLLPI